MKLLCLLVNNETHLGLKLSGGILDLSAAGYPRGLADTITHFAQARGEILSISARPGLHLLAESAVSYLAPASATSKVLCVGLNYKQHVDETKAELALDYPQHPILFSKFTNTLNGHHCPVRLSPNAVNYDYEAELVIVMGKGGMDIPEEKAGDYIFGYTCGNDVSARDAQRLTPQWLIGKNFPGFAPAGPWVVTADELDPGHLAISCSRAGETVQNSNTEQMIFDVNTIVSFASRYIRLEPGDLIFTGTPSGVIVGKEAGQQNWLRAGDEITVTIEGIGSLTSCFI